VQSDKRLVGTVISVYAMEAWVEAEVQVHSFFELDTSLGERIASRSSRFIRGKKNPSHPLTRKQGGPQGRYGRLQKRDKCLATAKDGTMNPLMPIS